MFWINIGCKLFNIFDTLHTCEDGKCQQLLRVHSIDPIPSIPE